MAAQPREDTSGLSRKLIEDARAGIFKPVYVLMGEEPYYIDRITERFEQEVIAEEDRNFNQIVLYGQDVTGEEVVSYAKQYPFGSDKLLVIVKEAKKISDFDAILSYTSAPSPTTILVIAFKYGTLKKDQMSKLDKSTIVFKSEAIKHYNVSKWVSDLAQEFKFKLAAGVNELIAEHIGGDLSRIYNEFVKLRMSLPENSVITKDIVEKNIGISKEYNIFELEDALGERNVGKAYKIALNFADHLKENPNVKTLVMLSRFYGNMLKYHLAPDKSPKMLEGMLNATGYVVNKTIKYAQNYSMSQLMRIISLLRECDVKTKGVGSNAEEGELLKELILKILSV